MLLHILHLLALKPMRITPASLLLQAPARPAVGRGADWRCFIVAQPPLQQLKIRFPCELLAGTCGTC